MNDLDEAARISWEIFHERAVEHNRHVEHGIKAHLVQSTPTVIVMHSCPCGGSFTTTDGQFSSGNKLLFDIMS